MKKYFWLLIGLVSFKIVVQFLGNRNYGFHRDELLHLSVSEHMDWGFMEFPPFIAWMGRLSYWLFDYSLFGVRLFPTLAGVLILLLTCQMAREMGAKFQGVFLAGICVLAFVPFYRNHTLFQPVAFDQMFWTLGFYFLIRFINTGRNSFLWLIGLTLGLGLMNKYTMLVWAFGVFIGLLIHHRTSFKNKHLYLSGLLALLIFLPNIIWQLQNDIPLINHLSSLNEKQLTDINPWSFLLDQLEIIPTFIPFIIGLLGLLVSNKLKAFRSLGIAAVVIFFTMWFLKSKSYYIFALYPLVFAAGAVMIGQLLRKRSKWIYLVAASIFLAMVFFIPEATPILPIERFTSYAQIKEENGRVELTGDYADMFGWEEQVQLVDSLYRSLSEEERAGAVIWAENYGEAGALKILGKKYDLPNPISRHGSFWLWGYRNKDAKVWISLGNEANSVEHVFKEVELIRMITHKYAIEEENGIPLYLCRKPKIDIEEWWQEYKDHIFD